MIKSLKKEQWLIGVLAVILLIVIIVPIPQKKEDKNSSVSEIYEEVLLDERDTIEQLGDWCTHC